MHLFGIWNHRYSRGCDVNVVRLRGLCPPDFWLLKRSGRLSLFKFSGDLFLEPVFNELLLVRSII